MSTVAGRNLNSKLTAGPCVFFPLMKKCNVQISNFCLQSEFILLFIDLIKNSNYVVTSGFCRNVNVICALYGFYAA